MYDYFFRMIGRMVRELSRGIARSPEMKNIQRDLRNMAKDVQREFSSYQGRGDFSPNDEDGGWRQDNGQPHPDGDSTDAQSRRQYSAQNQYGTNRQGNSHVSVAPKNKYKTVSTAGILFTVFGGIGLGVFLIFLLMTTGLTLLTDMFGMPYLFLSIVLLILTGISIWMLAKGISLLKRTSRLKKYLKIVGSSQFCPIDMLVRESGFDHAFVLKDLQKMIQKRVLPDAHIDDQKTCLMLGDEIYQQYLYVQSQAQRRQQAEQRTYGLGRQLGIPVVSGSDTHQAVQYGCIRTGFEKEVRTVYDLYEEMKAGRYEISVSDYAAFQVRTAGLLKKALKEIHAIGGNYVSVLVDEPCAV